MKVCLLGERSDQLDEGMKNLSNQLHQRLNEQGVDTTLLDLRNVSNLGFWRSIWEVDPDIFHLIPGPTVKGLTLLQILSQLKGCNSVATVTQSRLNQYTQKLVSGIRPSLIFTQSKKDQNRFQSLGFDTAFLPSGVDLEAFTPADPAQKEHLRSELGLPQDEQIFLHVGHFKQGRGVENLTKLQTAGQLVVVGSPSTGPEADIVDSLRKQGAIVETEYVPNIQDYYRASDIYVFPVDNSNNSIQAPLSVLEAMACNLPVITTRFGGLTDLFDEGGGLRFISSFENFDLDIRDFGRVETRRKVSKYSWDEITKQTISHYQQVCNAEH